ncbi:putative oxidoreductase C736.13-like protein 6 [Colletotrichum chlorophyti]|uniref:Putative oxidoreductase C736.13-like protein 6 n=1 Tax=Colletotrichum chlorophyti TaxID=708187 RepID=A0A1Q8RR54_9PEZI|nr:putative oxidoreductase C736.13-like protein 6 [Colletotrichum chlorophyti]
MVIPKLQLDGMTTIGASSEESLAQESTLHVLFNNASVTVQDYELHIGIKNLGHFLFTNFPIPPLKRTAQLSPSNIVGVVWVSSSAADGAPHPAIVLSNMNHHNEESMRAKYARSKAGNVIHCCEYALKTSGSGIALYPADFVTNLQQNMPKAQLAKSDLEDPALANRFPTHPL